MDKICSYRNCSNIIQTKRCDSFYCCRDCKNHEATYRKRDKIKKDNLKRMLILASTKSEDIKMYELIYGK